MNEYYLSHVAKLCHVEVAEICELPQEQLVLEYVLPKGLGKCGAANRQNGVSEDFMNFMARFGVLCYSADYYTGDVLYTIALQRIMHGAVPCRYNLQTASKFADYEVADAEPKNWMTPACWAFLRDQMHHILLIDDLRECAQHILFAILDNISVEGKTSNKFILLHHNCGIPDPRDVFAWARNLVDGKHCLINRMDVRSHFAQPELWHHYLWYWHEKWPIMCRHDKNNFYRNAKISGCWQKFLTRRKIKRYAPILH